ncbi:MAG: hypothetical protein K2W82_08875 [Candidatus Obscuribacterales bacterium]|nr:hypothetical protein [Candidatus Obscuribacterales bacterium]
MTAFRNIVFFAAFLLVLFVVFTTLAAEDPVDQAKLFLQKLEQGDRGELVDLFGDNTCNCQPRGGYIAYLLYRSGEQNNLNALLGQSFSLGQPTVKSVPTKSKYQGGNLPWEQPESTEIDLPISFAEPGQAPYFLPLDMAFGYEMKAADFEQFCRHPEKNFADALALRIRPSLKPGLITEQTDSSKNTPEFTADFFAQLLNKEQSRYLRPKDAAGVRLPNGKVIAAQELADKLPRLKAANLKLLVGRRSKYKRWAVSKVFIRDPQLLLADGTLLKLVNRAWTGSEGGNTIPVAPSAASAKTKAEEIAE